MKLLMTAHRTDETKLYDKANKYGYEITYTPDQLTPANAGIVAGYDAVAINAGCRMDKEMALRLQAEGVKFLLTRTAGYEHIDLAALKEAGIPVANVPGYSPSAISEDTILLILASLRKLKKQLRLMQEQYFYITGLRGRELRSMTVGVIGTGRIGMTTIRLLSGFGCRILADAHHHQDEIAKYGTCVTRDELLRQSDIVVLHTSMRAENYHMIGKDQFAEMKDGAILVNTARGGLVDTEAAIEALQCGKLSAMAIDVYENDGLTQRQDFRGKALPDPLVPELLAMDNVIYTSHTAFYTDEAISNIAEITIDNLHDFETTGTSENQL